MRRKKSTFGLGLMLGMVLVMGGCFQSPTDPIVGGGSLPGGSRDTSTTDISATLSQVDAQGLYVSVVDQDGNPLDPRSFSSSSFTVVYNGATIPSGSLSISTAGGSGKSISSSLVLDYSGSMYSTDIANMESAATSFVNNMRAADRGEIIKFGDYPVVEQAYTSDKDALRASITRTTAVLGGSTAFYDATYQGLQDTAPESGQKAVIAFTDGYENNSVNITTQSDLIAQAKARGIPVFTVGLGSADTTGLQAIALQTNGRYYYAPDSSQLAGIYQQIAQVFSSTMIISWPTFSYVPGATVLITITYVCASGSYTTAVSMVLP